MHPKDKMERLITKWKPYKEPCSCCDHDSSDEGVYAGNRTNELFEMIQTLSAWMHLLGEETSREIGKED